MLPPMEEAVKRRNQVSNGSGDNANRLIRARAEINSDDERSMSDDGDKGTEEIQEKISGAEENMHRESNYTR